MPISSAVVHRPSRLREERRHVATRALRLPVEDRLPALRGGLIERLLGRLRSGDRQLVVVQRRELRRDDVRIVADVVEVALAATTGYFWLLSRGSKNVPWPYICVFGDVRVPVGHGAPARVGVQIDASEAERRRDQTSRRSCRRAGTPCRPDSARRRSGRAPSWSRTARTFSSGTSSNSAIAASVGDIAAIAPTSRSRLGQPQPAADSGGQAVVDGRMTEGAGDARCRSSCRR